MCLSPVALPVVQLQAERATRLETRAKRSFPGRRANNVLNALVPNVDQLLRSKLAELASSTTFTVTTVQKLSVLLCANEQHLCSEKRSRTSKCLPTPAMKVGSIAFTGMPGALAIPIKSEWERRQTQQGREKSPKT